MANLIELSTIIAANLNSLFIDATASALREALASTLTSTDP